MRPLSEIPPAAPRPVQPPMVRISIKPLSPVKRPEVAFEAKPTPVPTPIPVARSLVKLIPIAEYRVSPIPDIGSEQVNPTDRIVESEIETGNKPEIREPFLIDHDFETQQGDLEAIERDGLEEIEMASHGSVGWAPPTIPDQGSSDDSLVGGARSSDEVEVDLLGEDLPAVELIDPAESHEQRTVQATSLLPDVTDRVATEPEIDRAHWTESARYDGDVEVKPGVSNAEFPSAKAIFAAQGRRVATAPQPTTRATRRRPSEPVPTDILAPAQWTMPLWIGGIPTLMIALMAGVAGLGLAYEWMIEANNSSVGLRLALRPEGASGSTIDPSLIPRGGWWTSNAIHLSAWAVALERAGDGEDRSVEIRSLTDASLVASRLGARSRFLIQSTDTSIDEDVPAFTHLGKTRDVVSLVMTARQLRKAGKLDASLKLDRSAMEIASRAEVGNLDPPVFDDNIQVLRYALPRESLVMFVVNDLLAVADLTWEQWTEALPSACLPSAVAMRALAKVQKRSLAERMADQAIRQMETKPPDGFDPAEHHAAAAEALAYRGRWTDAAEQYRLAIDLAEDDSTRRRWWLNFAEVAHRLNDDAGRARAIEAAKAPDSIDEVTRRAVKLQQGPGLVSSAPRR